MVDNVNGDVIIYQTDDGLTKIDVRVENETVWLSQQQMAELFGTSRTNIIEHINNIYAEEELDKELTCQNFRQVRKEGNRNVTREIPFYNLDMIISLGYRIKSKIATNFRRWATERLKEYMIKGFTMDDERLKGNGGGNYWKELLARIKDGGVLPMITSCSPGWINYAEYYYGDQLDHLSSCKSPHQMQGAIIKSYFAEKNGLKPEDIFVVSIMPCTAKKFEKERPQLQKNGIKDVDAVLTTRELAKLIKRSGINFAKLPNEEFDQDLMGEYTGAGVIFGATGGVMEAALRTAYHELTGKEYEAVEFTAVRGMQGLKEATLNIAGSEIKVAVASGMRNAKVLMDEIRSGKSPYTFIEIMGCPGGCVNGGGQPYVKPCFLPNEDNNILDTYKEKRAQALYSEDERQKVRQSHNNKQVQKLYSDFLGKPNSHKAHELLHTTYVSRERFPKNK